MTPGQLTEARKIAAISPPGSGIALLVAHIDAQAAEIERLRADAKRYRWLKNEHLRYDPVCHLSWKLRMDRDSCQWVNTAILDADIDHAMKETK